MRATELRHLLWVGCASVMIGATNAGAATLHTIDVLGVYPDHVAQRLTDPEAAFVSNIEYANKALQNSGANYRYNLVHVEQRNWPQDNSLGSSQLESIMQDPNIKALRDEYGADWLPVLYRPVAVFAESVICHPPTAAHILFLGTRVGMVIALAATTVADVPWPTNWVITWGWDTVPRRAVKVRSRTGAAAGE